MVLPQFKDLHSHGGMSMDGNATGGMSAWMHVVGGDTIWFEGWAPSSPGAIAAATIGLFLLAIVERWLSAMRTVMEAWWKQKAEAVVAARLVGLRPPASEKSVECGGSEASLAAVASPPVSGAAALRLASIRTSAPFILSHDLSRGVLHAMQSAISYALMLAVMTFQVAYFIGIVVGLGVGEFLFGRYGRGAGMH